MQGNANIEDERGKHRFVVGSPADFPPGTHRVVEVAGRHIGVFNIGGRLFGLPNRCPHQGGPLCEGRMLTGTLRAGERTGWRPEWVQDGEIVTCPWHGLEFHVPTGTCLADSRIALRRYEVAIEDDEIVLWMAPPRRS